MKQGFDSQEALTYPSTVTKKKNSSTSPSTASNSAPAYAQAGVDLDSDEAFVEDIKEIAKTTSTRREVLSSIGGFAGMFKAPERYKEPIMVACTDGVGTKLKLAAELGVFDTIGIDCVAMVVNDLVVQGAEPLIFLDYLAMGQLDQTIAKATLSGLAEGCRQSNCALLGGETATMPGIYPKGEIEIVGFSVGVVERAQIIDGSEVHDGDAIVGIGSSGVHSNGFSLVRKIVDEAVARGDLDLYAESDELGTTPGLALLAPTRIYVKAILNLMRDFTLRGIVHITGGGFVGNIPRILPDSVMARVDPTSWTRPGVFPLLQRLGGISEDEMLRVFNCGIGMALIVPPSEVEEIIDRLRGLGETAFLIGQVQRKDSPDDPSLELVTPS